MPKKYTGDGIDVLFEPGLCIHSRKCVDGLPNVFDPQRRPWIQPANADAGALAAVIARCPTGALHYVCTNGAAELPDADSVTMVGGGPLYVRGEVTVQLQDGTVVRRDTRMALCRCGQSKNKPYCDNSHIEAKFEG